MSATALSPDNIGRESFLLDFAVTRETAAQFDRYASLLTEWQSRMNLVAPSTLPIIWQRHFYDSAQLFPLLPKAARTLVDIGSGAGFPGLVLALLAQMHGRALSIHLVESIQKKAAFLRHVAAELALPVTIHAQRTESLTGLRADLITARAVAPLPELFRLCQPLLGAETQLLFLKGRSVQEELTKAQTSWHFDCRQRPSRTVAAGTDESEGQGVILRISHLRFITPRHRQSLAGGKRPDRSKA